jgi:glycosyltransferase involved in cell wall biosynthesis
MGTSTGQAATGAPRVTVVTPFYNSAATLDAAIQSVLAQDYPAFDYVLADNCSTDGSRELAAAWAARDPRVRLVTHTEFIDQDANYNRALGYLAAEARYAKIVQADDRLLPGALAGMVALGEAHPTAGIIAGCFLAGDVLAGGGLPFEREFFTGREACRTRLLAGGTYFGSPTCLLYRAEVVRERPAFYRPDETNADTTACFEILARWDFARLPQLVCWLRRDAGSVSGQLNRLGTPALLNYALVRRYGAGFLSDSELADRTATLRSVYLRLLARRGFDRPGQAFWDFHRAQLARLGEPWPAAEIRGHQLRFILDKLLNPRQTYRLLRERGRGGPPGPG